MNASFRRPESKALHAVENKKFADFLKGIGLYEDAKAGKLKCKFCRKTATLESITYVFPEAGSIKVVCSEPVCVNALIDHINEGKLKV